MVNHNYLTEDGYKQLQERLNILKSEKRIEIAKKLQSAREFGDLSENAEYDSAKEEQSILETEIFEIEQKLKTAKIINENEIDTNTVSVGSFVRLLDLEFNEEIEYKIVGTTECDPKKSLISNESPIGSAILGKHKNDEVTIHAPMGLLKFKIIDIKR